MEEMSKVFGTYTEEEQVFLWTQMQINAFFGTPCPQNAKEFKEWCDREINKMSKKMN